MNHGPRPTKWTAKLKRWLTQFPLPYSATVDVVNRLARFNQWRKQHLNIPYFPVREELYTYLINEIVCEAEITFLEFGVWRGKSMSYWTQRHQNPKSRFFGFDTFEGLPESWDIQVGILEKGHFSTGGELPKIADPRVHFFKGLFQDTLPGFLASDCLSGRRLVINNDSDLYSSTLFTLCTLHPFLRKGTIIIFDEFSHVLDEFRALEDYVGAFRRKYEVLAASGQYYDRVVISFVE
jgi:O-methyltransferase